MKHGTFATNAGNGNVVSPRACAGAHHTPMFGTAWHVGSTIASTYVMVTDIKLRGRWPEGVASL